MKHSSKPEFLRSWKWRWVALNDTQISVYQNRDGQLLASVQIDQGLSISAAGKIVVIQTNTRKLSFMARNSRFANEWVVSAQAFYGTVPRAMACASGSAYPIREHIDCRIYTNSRDYYMNLTVSILRATETIFIAAFALNPGVVLTRPPLPPVRLDQLLKTKADQGVLILINLNKDASGVVGYPQYKSESVKRYLMSLSTNIEVIRHPSAGKNTWSHHDNVIVVDRNVAYISGLELCYGCYDDSNNSVDDETGCRFPGPDYVQPHPSLHCPVRTPQSAVVGQSGAYNALEVYSGIDSSSSGQFQPRTRHHESFTSPSALIGDWLHSVSELFLYPLSCLQIMMTMRPP